VQETKEKSVEDIQDHHPPVCQAQNEEEICSTSRMQVPQSAHQ
jgi:hypothetical protein